MSDGLPSGVWTEFMVRVRVRVRVRLRLRLRVRFRVRAAVRAGVASVFERDLQCPCQLVRIYSAMPTGKNLQCHANW
jgi:hypothetical protein